jgi:mRNA-degrading endonuclease RelE of RelBE toxin-antitoxin system
LGPVAAEAICHFPPGIKRAVRSAIRALSSEPASGEPLHGELEGLYKRRVRGNRIVYAIDRAQRRVDILAVGEGRSIYEEVAELLRAQK